MACITSVTYRVNVNWIQGEVFEGGKGLKQGVPLSPLMFVLAMEYLTRLMNIAGEEPHFQFHPSSLQFKQNHLMLADNVIIFSKAHLSTSQIIKSTLEKFYQVTGLKANPEKSQIVCGGCNSHLQQQWLETTGYKEGCLPTRYLGVPITASKLSQMECHTLVEKIIEQMK